MAEDNYDPHYTNILSPWHDKDINKETGELKKAHRHGALYFESLKSYSQVSELLTEHLNSPAHVEIVMSPKGMYDYFTHAENPEKTLYDIIEEHNFTEFNHLVRYARTESPQFLNLIMDKTYFFAKYLDSRRHSSQQKQASKGEYDD